jgi:hypothetical protein
MRPDALRVFAVQSAAAGLERAEHAHVLPQVEQLVGGEATSLGYAARALLAAGLATTGSRHEARRRLDALAADGFAGLFDDHLRPQALRWLCEAIVALGAADAATALLPVVEPYAGQLLVGPAVTTIDAAADRAIAQLLRASGRLDDAAQHYERAAALEAELGFTALELHTRRWWIALLRERGDPGDVARADAMAADVVARADALGLRTVADACRPPTG